MNFTMPQSTKGFLFPNEVHFFYYDIMRDTENSIQIIYDWNSDIEDYLNSRRIVIDTEGAFPATVEKNCLYFTICKKDNESKAIAFFRHLRNAFVHFQIVHDGEYLRIEDRDWNTKDKCWKRTMIGQIKYEDLKELCFLFFKQKDKFIEENNI